ncbi:MAG: phosphoribosylformylglycinamidine cyclo-ligase [bacterium]
MAEGNGFTYRDAGVDVDAAEDLVAHFRALASVTRRPEVLGDIGGFGALFQLDTARYRAPVLVSSTDGVGTKLRIAFRMGRHDTVGIDLVAMVVNDLLPQAAEPLFFLDYFATGLLEAGVAERVVAGIRDGCAQARCSLIGGETAEMPDSYPAGEYDLAGFAVGVVERERIPSANDVAAGDVLIGLPSSGLHSNGYSLVRRVLFEHHGLDPHLVVPDLGSRSLGEVLLTPTRIYCRSVLAAFGLGVVRGAAHITGGSFEKKLPRCLPVQLAARIDRSAWTVPAIFRFLVAKGVGAEEAWRTFNMGVGMVLIVPPAHVDDVCAVLRAEGEAPVTIGEVVPRVAEGAAIEWLGPP